MTSFNQLKLVRGLIIVTWVVGIDQKFNVLVVPTRRLKMNKEKMFDFNISQSS